MPDPTISLVISTSDAEVATAAREEIDRFPDSQTRLSQRRNLDGDVAAWIVLANIASQALPHVFAFLGQLLDRQPGGVKRIKVGDVEIENPTRADVDRLLAQRSGKEGAET